MIDDPWHKADRFGKSIARLEVDESLGITVFACYFVDSGFTAVLAMLISRRWPISSPLYDFRSTSRVTAECAIHSPVEKYQITKLPHLSGAWLRCIFPIPACLKRRAFFRRAP